MNVMKTEEERRAKTNECNLDLISKTFFSSRNELAHPVMGTIFLNSVYVVLPLEP